MSAVDPDIIELPELEPIKLYGTSSLAGSIADIVDQVDELDDLLGLYGIVDNHDGTYLVRWPDVPRAERWRYEPSKVHPDLDISPEGLELDRVVRMAITDAITRKLRGDV